MCHLLLTFPSPLCSMLRLNTHVNTVTHKNENTASFQWLTPGDPRRYPPHASAVVPSQLCRVKGTDVTGSLSFALFMVAVHVRIFEEGRPGRKGEREITT